MTTMAYLSCIRCVRSLLFLASPRAFIIAQTAPQGSLAELKSRCPIRVPCLTISYHIRPHWGLSASLGRHESERTAALGSHQNLSNASQCAILFATMPFAHLRVMNLNENP
ncbi:hypothetical protein BD309DRAFT_976003 [Dichomitus squalens]|nr:hypothetical protein BD309DRAFT_976003 [Dichomitus squalens]